MHLAYFATHFRADAPITTFPREFAIITASATTGEHWTNNENRVADDSVRSELCRRWDARLEGFSPRRAMGSVDPARR